MAARLAGGSVADMDKPSLAVVVAGASGFVGTELVAQLRAAGHTVTRLVRRPARAQDEHEWNPTSGALDPSVLDAADAVVNLSGASLTRLPWTHPYKRRILESRVSATRTLTDAIVRAANPPSAFVSGSAVGFYGDRPGELLSEKSEPGDGYLARVVRSWEAAALPAAAVTRLVNARTGVVVGVGGAMRPLLLLTRLGLGGPLGSGEQHWPWISLRDEAAALIHLAAHSSASGPVNLVAPTPATQGQLGRELAERLRRPYWLPAPGWAIRLALARAGTDLILADQLVSPDVLNADGFQFHHETVAEAIAAMSLD